MNFKIKRIITIIAVIYILLINILHPNINAYATDSTENIGVRALSAVVLDEKNNSVLWSKNENEVRAMASLTKIMTAIVALDSGIDLDAEFTVSSVAASMPETKLFMRTGEKYKLEDLLYAIMLKSANDAAVVIAEGIGGSVEGFCRMMNEKAINIGCVNTNFISPNGLDYGDKSHHTTAKEMAMIASYALKNETFRNIITQTSKTISNSTGTRSFNLSNSNRLLSVDGVKGIKTGYTNLAGQCFAGYYNNGEKSFITVVLASGWGKTGKEAKWTDTTKMMNYINDEFENKVIINKNQTIIGDIYIEGSYDQKIKLYSKEELSCLLGEEIKEAKANVYVYDNLKAPINKGAVIATADIEINGQKRGEIELYTVKEIIDKNFENSTKKIINILKNIITK